MITMNKFTLIGALLLSVSFSSCVKDLNDLNDRASRIKEVQWDPAFAAPLINTTLVLDDLIQDVDVVEISEGPDGTIIVSYKGEVVTVKATDFVELGDQSMQDFFNPTSDEIDSFNSNGSVTIERSYFIKWDIGDVEIDELEMFISNHSLLVQTDIDHQVNVDIRMPGISYDGNPLRAMNGSLEQNGNNKTRFFNNGLTGYDMDMNDGPDGHSELLVEAKITITSESATPLSTAKYISIQHDFVYNQYETIHGYIGKFETDAGPEVVSIGIFEESLGGASFSLVDPQVKIAIRNSFGVPIVSKVSRMDAYSDGNPISIAGIPDPLPIPILSPSEIGQVKRDSIFLTKDNSNFVTAVNNQPDSMVYGFEVDVNPQGPTSTNFITRNSEIGFDVEVDIPLWGTASNFSLKQDQEFELALEEDVDIENLIMKVYTENKFPVDLEIQLYFYDSTNNTLLDSLIEGKGFVLDGGKVDASGKVNEAGININEVTATGATIDRVRDANQVRIVGRFSTTKINGQVGAG